MCTVRHPLCPAPSPCQMAAVPPFGAGRRGTRALKLSPLLQGCLWAGIAVCPAGATQAGLPQCLREFCPLGERDKADGEHGICCSSVLPQTAQQGRERGAGWRRLLPVPQLLVFLRGFPHSAFTRVAREPCLFPRNYAGILHFSSAP